MSLHYEQKLLWHSLTESYFTHESLSWPAENASSPEDKLLVKADYSLISLGTEKLVTTENIPEAAALRMRIPYMRGEFNHAFTYGYSLVGTVIEGPDDFLNKRVHLLHPHQRFAAVAISDVCILPENFSPQKATLISNMETALNAIWDAQVEVGDTIAVIGYGTIGTLVAVLAQAMPGVNVTVIEEDKQRLASANNAGFSTCYHATELATTPSTVFNTAASSSALQSAIDAVATEGTVVELCWNGANTSRLYLGDSFHYDRKRIISSQVSQIPQRKTSRWNYVTRKALVIKLLASVDHTSIIEKELPFDEADQFFSALRRSSPIERGILINYQE